MDLWLIILLSVLGGLLVAFLIYCLCIGHYFFKVSFLRRKGDANFAANEDPKFQKAPNRVWFFSQKIEELTIESGDQLKLKGYFLNNNSHKLAILVHGYHGRYYSSDIQAHFFYERGYDVLLINNRCHDTSEGKYFTMGSREKYDLLKWIYTMLQRKPDYRICLYGVSMGGHIVMMTSSLPELPDQVKCAVEDCGYSSLKDELTYELKTVFKVPGSKRVIWVSNIYCKLFHHFDLSSSTAQALPNCKIPMMFIQGDSDDYVPSENLEINASYFPQNIDHVVKQFPGCGHNESVRKFTDEYKKLVVDFTDKYLEK